MRLSLIGMAGSGKSYWSRRLSRQGFTRCCDDMIAEKLAPELKRPDGGTMKVSEWMGFPYEPYYEERESRYLTYEIEVMGEILGYLEHPPNTREQNIVIDTTGSVIYTGHKILTELQRLTTVVHLETPPEVQGQLLKAYISEPHPMLWQETFNKKPHESRRQALLRCYPRLFSNRQRSYEQYADVTLDYFALRKKGFRVSDFLRNVGVMREEEKTEKIDW
jgi:shikimate kinase